MAACHRFVLVSCIHPFLQSMIKDVQSESFCWQMVWSLLHEGYPILIVSTDVIFIFLHYLPAPIICCFCVLQPRVVSEGTDRDIHPEEWLFSHCQGFVVWVALLIPSRGPPSITKVVHACAVCSSFSNDPDLECCQSLWIITQANFTALNCCFFYCTLFITVAPRRTVVSQTLQSSD